MENKTCFNCMFKEVEIIDQKETYFCKKFDVYLDKSMMQQNQACDDFQKVAE